MHIIIGAITAIVSLLWVLRLLQNAGVDLNAFNPFTWHRRRQWAKKAGQKALYNLDKPMDVAAALLIGAATLEGQISREQKKDILDIFEHEFNLTSRQATDLFLTSSYLLTEEDHLVANINKVLEKSMPQFTEELSDSLLSLIDRVCSLDGPISESQRALLSAIQNNFKQKSGTKWD